MKYITAGLLILIAANGCVPVTRNIEPKLLADYASGDSLSTVWYIGSDASYHYFDHFIMARDRYKISRTILSWPDEFKLGTHKPTLVRPKMLLPKKNSP